MPKYHFLYAGRSGKRLMFFFQADTGAGAGGAGDGKNGNEGKNVVDGYSNSAGLSILFIPNRAR
jgi:hypothetical protein